MSKKISVWQAILQCFAEYGQMTVESLYDKNCLPKDGDNVIDTIALSIKFLEVNEYIVKIPDTSPMEWKIGEKGRRQLAYLNGSVDLTFDGLVEMLKISQN